MYSSGVFSFCGNSWLKLIVSRRYDKKGSWGRSLKYSHLTVYFALHTDTYMDLDVRFSLDIGPHNPSMPFPLKIPYKTNRYGRRWHGFLNSDDYCLERNFDGSQNNRALYK